MRISVLVACLVAICASANSNVLFPTMPGNVNPAEVDCATKIDFLLEHAKQNERHFPAELLPITRESIVKFYSPQIVSVTRPSDKGAAAPIQPKDVITPGTVIQIGKFIWNVIENNQAVVNLTEDWGAAVPKGVTQWRELQHWKNTQLGGFKFEFKNFLGMRLTEFDWTWIWKYNGNVNGTGLYVTEAGAAVDQIYAYLTENVNVHVNAFHPINYGTKAHPIGGIDLQLTMTSAGCFEKTEVGCHITMRGNGEHEIVSCDQDNPLL